MPKRVNAAVSLAMLGLLAGACRQATRSVPVRPTNAGAPASGSVSPFASASSSSEVTKRAGAGAAATTTVPASKPAPGAVNPNAPELVEPGDIPDNQAFVAFSPAGGTFTVRVPEGWARTAKADAIVFTDKYNSIAINSMGTTVAPTPDSVRAVGLTDVSSDPTFRLLDVSTVIRKAGGGVLAKYEIGSTANKVTGKKALLAVERFVFFHNGTTVLLTLSGAKGADNVDPWRTVSDSLAWK